MEAFKNILVTGANGQVGNEFRTLATAYPGFRFLFASRDELTIDDPMIIKNYFDNQVIDFCINCAAYTAVDKAETEKEKAFSINATAVGQLAAVCKAHNTRLIHISTDYVFDGKNGAPYKETDKTNSINTYGASKLQGEFLALENNPDVLIIRSSWIYSSFGNNFVKTMIRLMNERTSISVVNDQIGSPTYAADLAAAIMEITLQTEQRNISGGIYHYANQGAISWYEFARAIADLTNNQCIINPITTNEYPTPAMRAQYTVLETALIRETFKIQIPEWKDSLQKCLNLLTP